MIVFIWIPKAAGTSVWRAMRHSGTAVEYKPLVLESGLIDGLPAHKEWCDAGIQYVTFFHADIAALPCDLSRTMRVAIVRNPWDRLVSLYHYLHSPVGMAKPRGRALASLRLCFDDFVVAACGGRIPPPGASYFDGIVGANPQTCWTRNATRVWRLEDLPRQWPEFQRATGVTAPLPHINRGERGPYRDHYTPALRHLVAKRFAEEIEEYGYAF